MLELVVAQRLGLTQQKRQLRRQPLTALDGQEEGLYKIIEVNERLAVGDVPGNTWLMKRRS